jgi:hypothetical protein
MPAQPASQSHPIDSARRAPTAPNAAFLTHLDRVSAVVQTWPVWKQELLGGKAVNPARPTAQSQPPRQAR